MEMISDSTFQKYRNLLKREVIDNGIKWGQGVLMNGNPAGWTVDLREAILTPYYSFLISQLFMKWVALYRPDYVAGMTVAAGCMVSQIVLLSQLCGIPTKGLFIRREPKINGMQRQIEGPFAEGSKVLLIDDLINSSDVAFKCIEILIRNKCIPLALAVIINFEKDGKHDLERLKIPIHHIFTLSDLNMTPPKTLKENNLYIPSWKAGLVNSGNYYAPKSGPVVGERRIFIGSDWGRFLSVHSNGVLDWAFPVGETYRGIQTTPIYRNGRVYFGAYDGYTYCLKASNGKVIWKQKWGDWVGCSSPIFDPLSKQFFIGIEYGSNNGDLCAFNGDDGTLRWRFKTQAYVTCAPGIDTKERTVFVGSLDKKIYALNIDDGNEKWSFETEGYIKGGITVDNYSGCSYFTSYDGFLYCLSKEGIPLWKRKLGRWLYSKPALSGDKIVVSTEADHIFCLDKNTGRIIWKRCMSDNWYMSGFPVIKYNRVYAGSYSGKIFIFNLDDGSLLWSYITGGPVMAPIGIFPSEKLPLHNPVLKIGKLKGHSFNPIQGRLYYPGESGLINIFNSEATQLIWHFTYLSGEKTIPPYSNVMIVSSNDGHLYCFIEPAEQ